MKMSNGEKVNPAFINDDGKTCFAPAVESKANENSYILEMKDLKKAKEAEEEYDPYLYREVEHPTTNNETLLHLLKGSLGTGILSMPMAFTHSGYAVGVIATIIIGCICAYCIHLLIKAEYELCKRQKVASMTYPATAEAAFSEGPAFFKRLAPFSVHMVNTFLLIYQLGTCCVYTVFIADNIKSVADEYFEPQDVKIYMLMILLPLVFINYIRNLKFLAPFSTMANAITVVSFAIILYYLIRADITFDDREPVGKLEDFPLFFGTVLFALEAIGVIMPLENEMKTPKSFGGTFGVLNIGMGTIIFLYVGMGLLGYLAYGSHTAGTITLNIGSDIPAQVAKVMLSIAIYITHSLQMYVAIDIIWNDYLPARMEKVNHKVFWEYVTRTVLVLITFALAVAVPKLELFISLFGALCLSALGMAFPALIDSCTHWNTYTGYKFYLMHTKNFALILFGAMGLVIGTFVSLKKIIESFSE